MSTALGPINESFSPLFPALPFCSGSSRCAACRGSERSGFFLRQPRQSAPLCWRCRGDGTCRFARGEYPLPSIFQPVITVIPSDHLPSSITCAAITAHYRESGGKCLLFGRKLG